VIRGNLLVIPIEESLIYVQPLYLRAEGGRIPEMKRVVVAYQNQVVMEETLEAGLARLFGGQVGPTAAAAAPPGAARPANGRAADLARQAAELYRHAIEAQRSGDWARYGETLSSWARCCASCRPSSEVASPGRHEDAEIATRSRWVVPLAS